MVSDRQVDDTLTAGFHPLRLVMRFPCIHCVGDFGFHPSGKQQLELLRDILQRQICRSLAIVDFFLNMAWQLLISTAMSRAVCIIGNCISG